MGYKGHNRPSSYERQQPCAVALKAAFAGKHLSQISALGIEAYKSDRKTACPCAGGPRREGAKSDRCSECKHRSRTLAAATINRELTILKHLFNKAVKWKLADSNPMLDEKLYKENTVRIRHEAGTVPLHPDLAKALQELQDGRKPAPDDPALVNQYNKPWRSWRTAFANVCQRAGISDFRFHDLRHCFGSLAKNGTAIKARMELMRHKTPSMTMRYSHLNVEYKRSAVAKLPSFSGIETESQQISRQLKTRKVVALRK